MTLYCILLLSANSYGQQDSIMLMMTEEIECTPPKPVKINSFKDGSESIKWKVVTGRDIKYKAERGDDLLPFEWSLKKVEAIHGFNYTYNLVPKTPQNLGREGVLMVNNLWSENKYFGPANIELDNGTGGQDLKSVKLYFIKENMNIVTNELNWITLWKNNPVIKALLESIPKIKKYNTSTCAFEAQSGFAPIILTYNSELNYEEEYGLNSTFIKGTYGRHSSTPPTIVVGQGTQFCESAYPEATEVCDQDVNIIIRLGPGASRKKYAWNRPDIIIEGIHVFYSTLVHEVEHARIFYDNWKDGYSLDLYDEDKDYYHDEWEDMANTEMQNSTYFPKPAARFNDEIGQDIYQQYYIEKDLFKDPPKYNTGTEYEEWRCLRKEYDLFPNLNSIDPYDWSFDPRVQTGEDSRLRTQGKQWNN